MARGALAASDADVAVAITGIAGPDGGTKDKPVGTVVIGVLVAGHPLVVHTHLFAGGRELVRLQSTQAALERIRRTLIA